MGYQIMDCSPKAKKIIDSVSKTSRSNFFTDSLFEEMEIGKCIIIKFGELKEQSIRNLVTTQSKRLDKTFRCIKHKEEGVFEVVRVA